MKNRALRHGVMAAALVMSIGAMPTAAQASDYNVWRTNFGSTGTTPAAWMESLLKILG